MFLFLGPRRFASKMYYSSTIKQELWDIGNRILANRNGGYLIAAQAGKISTTVLLMLSIDVGIITAELIFLYAGVAKW